MDVTPTALAQLPGGHDGVVADALARKIARLAARRDKALAAYRAATDDLAAFVVVACDEGLPETRAAEMANVTRMTVRSWRRARADEGGKR